MVKKWRLYLSAALGICLSVFQIYAAVVPVASQTLRTVHVGLGLGMAFLFYPLLKGKKDGPDAKNNKILFLVDVILTVLFFVCIIYFITNLRQLAYRGGNPNTLDFVISLIAVILVLETTRRSLGWAMPLIALVFIAYAMASGLPGILRHRAVDIVWLCTHLYLTTEGIFGAPISASAGTVFMFLLFASALEKTGGGKFFMDLSYSVCGKFRGGAAKVAVIASGLMGMISGSAVANVAGVGSIAIPMMRDAGYSADDAAAIEAVSASGGLIMPPVMGAAAFIMAELLGVGYGVIMGCAAIPAILYYLSLFFAVDFIAGRQNLKGLPKEQLPKAGKVFREGWIFVIPLLILVYFIAFARLSANRSAFYGFVASIVLYAYMKIIKEKDFNGFCRTFYGILVDGARSAITIITACACAGIIVGVISLTGLGLTFSSALVDMAGGNLFLMLVLSGFACLILGMGLPITACYIILVVLAVPALTSMGVEPLAAHLFVMYFGVLSNITPPVALASYVAAGMSGSKPAKVAFTACKMALVLFILPFMFVYKPCLILQGAFTPLELIESIVTSTIGCIVLAGGTEGYFIAKSNILESILLFGGGLCLLVPETFTDIIGLALTAAVFIVQRIKAQKLRSIQAI